MPDVVIAVDVGGTSIKHGHLTRDGSGLRTQRHPTGAERGPAAVLETILQLVAGQVDAARADGVTPRAVGVAVPGVVDEPAGVVRWSANLGLRDAPLAAELAARIDLPVVVSHDVRAGAVAEARLGAGHGGRHLLFVAIGTGIAAAQIVDGRAYAGGHGAAGELGHVPVRPNGPPCACGGRGCLEAVASGAAVARRYAELGGGTGDAAQIATSVATGDELALRVWQETVAALADGLVIGQSLLDAEVIVLGGGLAAAGDVLLVPLRTAVKERLTFHREPRLVPAALGQDAGCVGAGLRAWEAV